MSDTIDSERFRKLLFSYPVKAIQFLYDSYYASLVSISVSLTHNLKASEDIVQETFVHVWEKHKVLGLPHDKSIQYYLVRVVKNKSMTYYRNHQRSEDLKKRNDNSSAPGDASVEAAMIETEKYHYVRKIISRFPQREKECLLMKIDEEMSTEQIAGALEISGKAVERSLTSAGKRLRRYLSIKR
ncbi:MAG: sigma-70 family RNA polymerase sigma factor [Bacteroidota bacterium]